MRSKERLNCMEKSLTKERNRVWRQLGMKVHINMSNYPFTEVGFIEPEPTIIEQLEGIKKHLGIEVKRVTKPKSTKIKIIKKPKKIGR